MPKTDNPQALRLHDSITNHAGAETAERIAFKMPLSKSADADKKFLWAESVCAALEAEFDDETVQKIRMDCACGPDEGRMDRVKKVWQSSFSMADFISKINALDLGFSLQQPDGQLLLLYPRCYCAMVKRIDKPLPKAWCYCTLGYAKKLFEHAFSRSVDVELLTSVKTGGTDCRIKIVV